jgi:biotin carboxyl carrier protein
MRFEVLVNGRLRSLELNAAAGDRGSLEFTLDSEPAIADVVEVEPGVYSILLHGGSYEAKVTPGAESCTVEVRGVRYEVTVRDPRRLQRAGSAPGSAGRQRVVSPMPGKVVRVLVHEGEEVAAGQGLVVVEAMKMQNEIRSPKAGRVVAMRALEGTTVTAGETLAEVE